MNCLNVKYFGRYPMRVYRNVRDLLLNKYISDLLIMSNMEYGTLLYSVLSANPTQIVISLLALKMGLSKSILMVILLFVL